MLTRVAQEQQIVEDLTYAGARNSMVFQRHETVFHAPAVKELTRTFKSPYEAAKNSHAIVVLTEWDEFKSLHAARHCSTLDACAAYDFQQLFDGMLKPAFLFDGRLILDHAALIKIGFDVCEARAVLLPV